MFVERALFDRVGGFPDQPLMEDVELSRRLKRLAGRPLCARGPVHTSGRRWDANGAWRTIVAMWRLRFDYWRGAAAALLARRYAAMAARRHLPTLQIFAKAAIPGAVKTRLAATEGAGAAASIHRKLVERTLSVARAAREAGIVDAVELWCAPDATANGFVEWAERFAVATRAQCDGDLGARMRHAIATAIARGERAIVIGTDCAELGVDYLRAAAVALDDHDAVLGPAEDGGYVLVGLARDADIFRDMPWSTSNVTSATRARLRAAGLRWHELPTLWDVDRPEDLARWRAIERAQGQLFLR
jgi:rSAM/selenodomain-associated transferase 1